MKIGLFSDSHYCQCEDLGLNRNGKGSFNKIKVEMEQFKK